jgi:transposase-like protein
MSITKSPARAVISAQSRLKIVKEYLSKKSSGTTLRSLQAKYGVDYRIIGNWVTNHRKQVASERTSNLETDLKQALQVISTNYGLTFNVKFKKSTIKIAITQ